MHRRKRFAAIAALSASNGKWNIFVGFRPPSPVPTDFPSRSSRCQRIDKYRRRQEVPISTRVTRHALYFVGEVLSAADQVRVTKHPETPGKLCCAVVRYLSEGDFFTRSLPARRRRNLCANERNRKTPQISLRLVCLARRETLSYLSQVLHPKRLIRAIKKANNLQLVLLDSRATFQAREFFWKTEEKLSVTGAGEFHGIVPFQFLF